MLRREAAGRVAEVDLAALGHHHRVGVTDRVAAHLVGEKCHLAVGAPRGDREQALHCVGGDQPAGGVEVEAEHAAAGVDEHLLSGAVGVHAHDVAAGHGRVELAVGRQHHVLGPRLGTQRDEREPGQPVVRRMRAGVARHGRRNPRDRADRHRPQCQVGREREHHGQQGPGDSVDHGRSPRSLCSSLGSCARDRCHTGGEGEVEGALSGPIGWRAAPQRPGAAPAPRGRRRAGGARSLPCCR